MDKPEQPQAMIDRLLLVLLFETPTKRCPVKSLLRIWANRERPKLEVLETMGVEHLVERAFYAGWESATFPPSRERPSKPKADPELRGDL